MEYFNLSKRSIGVNINEDSTDVLLWSPHAKKVEIIFNDEEAFELKKEKYGYWSALIKENKDGQLYKFRLNGQTELPDPASLYQPDGVHAHSMVLNLDFPWTDQNWKNPNQHEYIIYELHTGCFSTEGNFKGIIHKLDHLKELGINAIEIMPVAQFPGERNWGYDGVYPFAVQNSYGGPKGLQELVNACHRKGIAVILDVVYNHFGPEGNYTETFAPYFTDNYKTPWGKAINFDDAWCDGVRNYFIENAIMWFRDFHVDALRLDAVHAIKDNSPEHILYEIKKSKDALEKITGGNYYLIAEVDLNDPKFINSTSVGGYGMNAQWVDEFHHALRVTAGEKSIGYYSDFNGIEHLTKSYRDAYVFDGEFSTHRKKFFGKKTVNPGEQFIVFSQNHDQVGNRMLGERSSVLYSYEMQKLFAGSVLVSPFLPMLFMGEEWGETNPFLYFVDHGDKEIADAVRKGRKEEFADFHGSEETPDPLALSSFNQSKLQWNLLNEEKHNSMFRYYKELISIRKNYPSLNNLLRKQLHAECNKQSKTLLLHRWHNDESTICIMNFSKKQQFIMPPSYSKQWYRIIDSAHPFWLGPSAAPAIVKANQPGTETIVLQPESIQVYCNHNNLQN